ncbi:sodium/sugar symporter [Chitinophaga vietnamensis]|uniref:sodium/sugar symporter n=1 Tax=Chitinophaga vietnamensis TaxID=2593957 RepID=UPI0011787F48|nr:sodium/sugar symporter [Chitinophaga vietnamensis]
MQPNSLHYVDYLVFLVYFVIVAGYGFYIYNRKKKSTTDTKDFFLAEGSLTWWAIGASLIASNISAEQFIGMSGNGFNIGLAISTYEWMAAATLIVVAVFFLPIYLKNKIYTMPQFLERRYNQTVSTIMAVFWLLLYVIVNLTSILYLGALAITTISGINFYVCMIMLAAFAIIITLGGMKVIGYTDVIQVFFLILGGLATTYLALELVSSHFGTNGVLKGFKLMTEHASDHFHMILHKENPKYLDLPGLSVLIGGMWIVNLNYWGCNQYITQRALGADLKTARNGLLFAGFLKLLMPIIVVLPGIAAYVLYQEGMFQQAMLKDGALNADNAYPVLLNLLPTGLKGLAFAALTAAVVASLAGKANSISTIFSLDIYKKIYNKEADEKKVVGVGRTVVIVTMIIAIVISNFLGIDKKGGFQFIQEYTGFVSPGVFAMFIMGFFWKRTTSNAALFAMIGGLLLSFLFKFMPAWVDLQPLHAVGLSALNPDSHLYEMPFIDRMGFVFLICVMGMVIITLADPKSANNPKGLAIDGAMFKPSLGFTVGALLICGVLMALYTVFW